MNTRLAVLAVLVGGSACDSVAAPGIQAPPAYVQPYLGTWHIRNEPIVSGENAGWTFSATLEFTYDLHIVGTDTTNLSVTGPMSIHRDWAIGYRDTTFDFVAYYGRVLTGGSFSIIGNAYCCGNTFGMWGTSPQNDSLSGMYRYINGRRDAPGGSFVAVR
jgi:hypothetical protein